MMNDSPPVIGLPRRAWPPNARTVAAMIATAALALLAAACGGSPGSPVAQLGSTTTESSSSSSTADAAPQQNGALAFARCMRSKGVQSFPDPDSNGSFDKVTLGQLAASNANYQTAQHACQHLLPAGSTAPHPDALTALRFSQCMRSHGVRNFPDPGGDGRIPDSFGNEQGSTRFQAANQACRTYRPPYIPSNAAYNAYARTQNG